MIKSKVKCSSKKPLGKEMLKCLNKFEVFNLVFLKRFWKLSFDIFSPMIEKEEKRGNEETHSVTRFGKNFTALAKF